jgi:alkanesulfonate monooxygenase SsuD/methylene tetrahydromethanopterin reductase-like flavin-dependent oxidoreductase (luciferase family)
VKQAVVADEAGFSEYWVAEHATVLWEPVPNPEIIIGAAALQTKSIRFGPLGHLLPYHNPASLAVQTAWMSQALEGRYILGIAPGAYPNDAALRGMSDMSTNREMMLEAIDIMERVWKCEPFSFQGKFWNAGFPEIAGEGEPIRDLRPWGGKIEVAMTGLSAPSSTLNFAAAHGYYPSSVFVSDAILKLHFDDYERVSAEHGHNMDRSSHRVVRDVVVADTDSAARKLAIEGGVGAAWEHYLLPVFKRFGMLDHFLTKPGQSIADIDLEFLADNVWIVGSPETVREKMDAWCDRLGGAFGTLLIKGHDYMDDAQPWVESMQRLAGEVIPSIGAETVST